MTTDEKRLQDQMQAAMNPLTDEQRRAVAEAARRACDAIKALSTRSDATDRRESDERAEDVSEDADAGERASQSRDCQG